MLCYAYLVWEGNVGLTRVGCRVTLTLTLTLTLKRERLEAVADGRRANLHLTHLDSREERRANQLCYTMHS